MEEEERGKEKTKGKLEEKEMFGGRGECLPVALALFLFLFSFLLFFFRGRWLAG